MMNLELTLAIIKPHIVKNPVFLKAIRKLIISSNFKVVRSKTILISFEEAERFYKEHKHKFFYNRLVTFMTRTGFFDKTSSKIDHDPQTYPGRDEKNRQQFNPKNTFMSISRINSSNRKSFKIRHSGDSDIYILAKENAIKDWRALMGPTKVYKAQFESPYSIRGRFGLSDTRNATHGSDSPESSKREIGIFFPEFHYEKWYQSEEPKFLSNQIRFVENKFLHVID